MSSQLFLVVAGEASGDMYGADVARCLFRRFSGCRIYGLGGLRMREAGVELEGDIGHTAVVGPFEVISYLGKLYRVFRRLAERIEREPPTAAVLIDFPDFNLRLARRIFPFEEEIYRKASVPVQFVGHPLVDTVRASKSKEDFCRDHQLDPRRPIVALLPGSRRKEVQYILPTLCKTADLIAIQKPDTQFVLPIAPGLERRLLENMIRARPITVVTGETYNAIRYSRAAIVASGTATLETALLGTPEVIVYRISRATWLLGKFLLKVRLFGIVNIILGEEVVPELFQDKMTPEEVSKITLALMDDVWLQSRIRGNYEKLRRQLGEGNVAERVADEISSAINSERLQTRG